jgi:hypothetical protein
MPLVLAAMPSFRLLWDREVEVDNADNDSPGGRLGYLDAAALAKHAVELLAVGESDEVEALLDVIERLHVEGDTYVKELATIGYLEDLQHWADLHTQTNRDDVVALLGPVSRAWWVAVDRYWSGASPMVRLDGEDSHPGGPPKPPEPRS